MGDRHDSRRGGHEGRQGRYQGYKRRREDEDEGHGRPRGPDNVLALAIRLCKKAEPGDTAPPPSEQLDILRSLIARDVHSNASKFIRIILDCAVELPHKVPAYAALIGLINTEEELFVKALLQRTLEELNEAFKQGNRNEARLLLRLFAALAPCNALHASSVLKAFTTIVESAIEIADAGKDGVDGGRLWQPYTDYLVYSTLMALPWGGADLAEGAPAELDRLLAETEKYMDLRPQKLTAALRPFFEGEDVASMSDSGAASFLGQVWEAIQELKGASWKVANIPRYVDESNEAQIATSHPHQMEDPVVPVKPPCLQGSEGLNDTEAAAKVLAAYPPRGVIKLLPAETTGGDKGSIERLIVEEYILDTIHFFDGDRIQCAKTLALGLPIQGKLEPLLTEVIFSQMMRVPSSNLKPIAYATILADVCRLLQAVPRSMSACMREFFQRMHALDPQLRTLLAEWLAYHLSNFDFMWPWAKWSYVLQASPQDPQRRFVVDVFSKLVRLSYYGNVAGKVPEVYMQIFPPKPAPHSLEPLKPVEGEETEKQTADTEAVSASASEIDEKTSFWALQFIQQVRAKKTAEEVLQWASEKHIEDELGGKVGLLRMVLCGLLVAGSKSFTHMLIALERYDDLLTRLLSETGEEGQEALVGIAAYVWRNAPQRAAQAIDRLMAHRLVDGSAVLRWAFGSSGLLSLEDQISNGLAWEVLYNAVNKTLARTQDAREELQQVEAAARAGEASQSLAQQQIDTEGVAAEAPASTTNGKEEAAIMLPVEDDRQIAEKEQLNEKTMQLQESLQTEKNLLLLGFEKFREILSGGEMMDGVENGGLPDAEAESKKEWFKYTLAQLRAFTRKYHGPAASIAQMLEDEVFAEDKASIQLREAVVQSLHP